MERHMRKRVMNNKTINSGIYTADKKHINGGEPMEELTFESDTGQVTCYAEEKKHNEETQTGLKKAENPGLWLAWIAILIGVCFVVAGL